MPIFTSRKEWKNTAEKLNWYFRFRNSRVQACISILLVASIEWCSRGTGETGRNHPQRDYRPISTRKRNYGRRCPVRSQPTESLGNPSLDFRVCLVLCIGVDHCRSRDDKRQASYRLQSLALGNVDCRCGYFDWQKKSSPLSFCLSFCRDHGKNESTFFYKTKFDTYNIVLCRPCSTVPSQRELNNFHRLMIDSKTTKSTATVEAMLIQWLYRATYKENFWFWWWCLSTKGYSLDVTRQLYPAPVFDVASNSSKVSREFSSQEFRFHPHRFRSGYHEEILRWRCSQWSCKFRGFPWRFRRAFWLRIVPAFPWQCQ